MRRGELGSKETRRRGRWQEVDAVKDIGGESRVGSSSTVANDVSGGLAIVLVLDRARTCRRSNK
ncbi:hypothetical protein AMTR_s00051p00173080 [Amborella trichopoda]|uniref:Uncharacterized protein n=1 Tax=Amborella trichopoda TaxID=13333 RepID=U5D5G9_AMBTC|nr:hypothetical protein AMTR_s00051p00173080 [Amborella trichopoda]